VTATAVETRTHLVEVEFKGNRRAFYTWTGEAPPPARAAVIVQVERGEDLGRIHSTGELAEKRKDGTTHGKASPNELPKAVRLATTHEIDTAVRLRVDEESVRKAALELVRQMNLDMKVSDAEWQWDRRRLTCYFTAEERVDFRQLVRQLEKRFSTRVHMWHIGVRDEARRLDGVGRCGRQFCSASWLPELRPVKSSSAKDQRLSTLNPSQISGTCGRLMCCLRYEHEFYVQSRKRFPKEGKVVTTTVGEEKIVSNDIFRDLVTLRTATGEARTIPLLQLRRELGDPTIPVDDEPHHDEEPHEGHDAHHDAHEELEKREDRGRASGREDRVASETRSRESVREPRERVTRDSRRPDRGPRDLVPLTRAAAPVVPPAPVVPLAPAPPAPLSAPPASATAPDDAVADDELDDDAPDSDSAAEPGVADDSADAKKRGRRRRGRRGGRRGRSGDGKPGSPPAA
jgi:cell fate regulator YaaT (PSP1 superfamily)